MVGTTRVRSPLDQRATQGNTAPHSGRLWLEAPQAQLTLGLQEHFDSDLAGGDFAQRDDGRLIAIGVEQRLRAGANLPGAVGRGERQQGGGEEDSMNAQALCKTRKSTDERTRHGAGLS